MTNKDKGKHYAGINWVYVTFEEQQEISAPIKAPKMPDEKDYTPDNFAKIADDFLSGLKTGDLEK